MGMLFVSFIFDSFRAFQDQSEWNGTFEKTREPNNTELFGISDQIILRGKFLSVLEWFLG